MVRLAAPLSVGIALLLVGCGDDEKAGTSAKPGAAAPAETATAPTQTQTSTEPTEARTTESITGPLARPIRRLEQAGYEVEGLEDQGPAAIFARVGNVTIRAYSSSKEAQRLRGLLARNLKQRGKDSGLIEAHGRLTYDVLGRPRLSRSDAQRFRKIVRVAEGR